MTDLDTRIRATLHHVADLVDAPTPPLAGLDWAPERSPGGSRGHRRPTLAVALAVVLTLLVGAAAAATSGFDFHVRVWSEPEGSTMGGIENSDLFAPGAPFHCTGLFDMTPRQAQELVESRGFEATWQYDGRVWPEHATPPDSAFVDEVVLLDDDTARLIATPDRRPVRSDRGCPGR